MSTIELKEEGIHIVQMSLTPTNYGKNASIWLCTDVVHMHMHLRIILGRTRDRMIDGWESFGKNKKHPKYVLLLVPSPLHGFVGRFTLCL